MAPPATDAAATTKQEQQHATEPVKPQLPKPMAPLATIDAPPPPPTPKQEEQQHAAGGGEKGAEATGGGGDLRLVAECGTEVRLSRSAARMSAMLVGLMEAGCAEEGEGGAGGVIPIKGADAGTLRLVATYCERHAPHYDPVASAARLRDPFPPFPIDFTPANYAVRPVTQPEPDPHGLEDWDRKLIAGLPDNSALFSLILVANLMAIEDLVDLGCTAVAEKMRGKTPEEVRAALDIENDYTPEQEAEIRRENAWAFKD